MYRCLIFVVFLAVISQSAQARKEEHILKHRLYQQQCAKELSVSPETLANLKNNVRDENVECFVKCAMTKAGYFDAAGNFQVDYTLADLESSEDDPIKVKAVFDECLKTPKSDGKCSYAMDLWLCYTKDFPFPN